MPNYEPPRGDTGRLAFLQKAAQTGAEDLLAGNAYVSQAILDQINAFLPGFEAAALGVGQKLGARVQETQERAEAIEQVAVYVRDLWEVLKRRVHREKQPAAVLSYYQLPADGVVPKPTGQGEWLSLAALLVQGDAGAVAAGFPAMVNPSAAELQAVLAAARSEDADIAGADRAYDEAQEAVAAQRPQADELIQEVMDALRYNLRKKDPPGQRRIMRTYGATFSYLEGEPHDPDDPA